MTFNQTKADDYNTIELDNLRVRDEHVTEMTLLTQRALGLDADGMCGPRTRAALDAERAARTACEAPVLPAWQVAADRARSMVGKLTYVLGAGGRDPRAPTPETTRDGRTGCDCVGFVCWALGVDRYQPTFPLYGGWMNTDSIIADAEGGQAWWVPVKQGEWRAGDLLVFPSVDLDHDGDRDRYGHVGMLVEPVLRDAYNSDVVHCHGGPGRPMAVNLDRGDLWRGRETYKGKTDPRWRSRVVRLKARP